MFLPNDPRPFTVSEITSNIKLLLESRFQGLLLQGEVSNFKRQSSGHLYFSLKDGQSQIAAVMFRSSALHLHPLPKEGDQVIVKGSLTVYEPRGNYQIVVKELSYVGIGALLLQLEKLKTKLKEQGYFAPEKKKPLPRFPKTIGVVTSPTGAAIQDILNVLGRRHAGFHLILNPVKVQGEGASHEIAKAIEQFNQYRLADVLIVGRGGGSIEDLFAFNEEEVAHAVFHSQIPVISAVGHETDHTLADLVSDIRAPTPSAAAEIVLGEKRQHLFFLEQAKQRMSHTLSHLLKQSRYRLQGLWRHPLLTSSTALLGHHFQTLDDLKGEIETDLQRLLQKKRFDLRLIESRLQSLRPTTTLAFLRETLTKLQNNLAQSLKHVLQEKKKSLHYLTSHLASLDPKALLKKGYTLLFSENDHSLIISAHQLEPEQKVKAQLFDGQAHLIVQKVTQRENPCPTPLT